MFEIWKIECEWDSNIVDSMEEWIEKAGVDAEILVGRASNEEEAAWAIKQLKEFERDIEFEDGRHYIRFYKVINLDA